MSKHLTGSKRLAVIQRWINGHDDPDWEVLPTRKEGKYIVKKRETPIRKVQKTEEEESPENQEMEEESQETPKKVPKVPKKPPKSTFDPTINLEILNQLKLFGEEMERKRIKKEQKRMIKEVMNKEARRAPPPPEPEPEPETQPVPMQYPYRRRNRIFEGLY